MSVQTASERREEEEKAAAEAKGGSAVVQALALGAVDYSPQVDVGETTARDFFDAFGKLKSGAKLSYQENPQNFERGKTTRPPGAKATSGTQFVAQNDVETVMAAIGSIESGKGQPGRIDYNAVGPECGPRHKMGLAPIVMNGKTIEIDGHALGAWQIMPKNVVKWAKEAGLGDVTPEQFLKDPALQRQIAYFKIEQYMSQGHDVKNVASLWHAGLTLDKAQNSRDVNMSTPAYANSVDGQHKKLTMMAAKAPQPQAQGPDPVANSQIKLPPAKHAADFAGFKANSTSSMPPDSLPTIQAAKLDPKTTYVFGNSIDLGIGRAAGLYEHNHARVGVSLRDFKRQLAEAGKIPEGSTFLIGFGRNDLKEDLKVYAQRLRENVQLAQSTGARVIMVIPLSEGEQNTDLEAIRDVHMKVAKHLGVKTVDIDRDGSLARADGVHLKNNGKAADILTTNVARLNQMAANTPEPAVRGTKPAAVFDYVS